MLNAWSRRFLGLVVALASLAFVPRLLQAQTGKISGVVTDKGTGQPLEGVAVFLQGTGLGQQTNANGRFFILNVSPGTYTVLARRIGYQTVEQRNIQILIDVTREVNFQLTTSTTLQTLVITAQSEQLIQPGQTGSGIPLTAEQILALPVTSIEGALSLQQGFLVSPSSVDIISFTDSRRNTQNPISIRGGRGGETLQLIDGIPVQNFIFGGPALSLSPEAVQQVDFVKGGMGAEYGNALSGVLNIATKEGGSNLAGALKYQSSNLGGLANTPSKLRDYNLVEGFVSGPVPMTGDKLRFMFSGRQERKADAVMEFDNDIFVAEKRLTGDPYPAFGPNLLDVFPGWRGFGFDNTRQVFGKLAYNVRPQAKLSVTLLDNQRQRLPFDPQYLLTYGDPLNSPAVTTMADSVVYLRNLTGTRIDPLGFTRVPENSIRSSQQLLTGKWDHTINRTNYKIVAGTFKTRRQTCSYFQGVCLKDNFADPNFSDDQFISPLNGTCAIDPTCGADEFYGGEKLNTQVLRTDLQSQVTDHHNLQAGFLYQRYDLNVNLVQNVGTNNVNTYKSIYSAGPSTNNAPYDFGTYVTDRVEYDFLTLKLGARFDYGKVPGTFFADPLDPTNGTTAKDVCDNPSDARWVAGQNFASVDANGVKTSELVVPDAAWAPLPGVATNRCTSDQSKIAGKIAAYDDFQAATARKQFSPRIGISFPMTQTSSIFFNFGKFSQNPLLNNLLTNTGIGTIREGTTQGPVIDVPGEGGPGLIGNPNLQIEQSTTYEVGYASEFQRLYGLNVIMFNKNQTGLTGIRTGGRKLGQFGFEQVFDPGTTYGASNTPSYNILVNQDFQSVRGMEVQLRRRVSSYWGFDVNYSYSRARTNASDPEREFERQATQNDPANLTEVPSDIDQAHNFNVALNTRVDNRAPNVKFVGDLLRNVSAAITLRAQSGLPYTPQTDFGGSNLTRNSGRGPSTSQFDGRLSKGFVVSNMKYDAFVTVSNLFDRKNCVQVFTSTGTCSAGAIDQSRRRQGNGIGESAVTSTYTDRAYFFGDRRTMMGGLRVSF